MPFRKKPKEELVNAAMHPSATRKFLRKFHEYGRGKGWFPELPKNIREEELGKWIRKNTTLSDKELVEKMREWVHDYTSVKMIAEDFPELDKAHELLTQILTTPPQKTLSAFLQTHHGNSIAKSTALGEMAREMGFDVKYHIVGKEGVDKSKLTEKGKQSIERQRGRHAYVVIDGEQHDPAFNLSYTNHKGKPQTREEHAAMIWTTHGALLDEMGKLEKALTAHDIALELDPKNALLWNNKGVALSEMGRYEEALEHYDKALEIDSKDALAWINKAITLSEMGRYKEALEHHDKALEIDSKDALAWIGKAITLSEMERYEEALETIEETLDRIPKDHPLRDKIEELQRYLRNYLRG
ncbi:MAG: tetratricopeptide repeat protein [Candidatus Diapherotrites archaeon]|nr:tetratricopeptide repeat protein [Candidatus Diapherotrites archaeon]